MDRHWVSGNAVDRDVLDLVGDLDVDHLEAEEPDVVEGDRAELGVLDCAPRAMDAVIAVMPATVRAVPDVPLPGSATRCQAAGMTEVSPTARALRALEILQTRPGCTADDLAQRLGVT